MPAAKADQERRKIPRVDLKAHVQIDLPKPDQPALETPPPIEADSLNISEGGMSVRLREALEIRSQVRLRVFAQHEKKPLECAGRVAWVVQRSDLRNALPLYDVGLEFVDPSPQLRQFAARAGLDLKPVVTQPKKLVIPSAPINGRVYVPRLERERFHESMWHLIVWVDEVPCFAKRYPSQKGALEAWEQFKRDTARAAVKPKPAIAIPTARRRAATRPATKRPAATRPAVKRKKAKKAPKRRTAPRKRPAPRKQRRR